MEIAEDKLEKQAKHLIGIMTFFILAAVIVYAVFVSNYSYGDALISSFEWYDSAGNVIDLDEYEADGVYTLYTVLPAQDLSSSTFSFRIRNGYFKAYVDGVLADSSTRSTVPAFSFSNGSTWSLLDIPSDGCVLSLEITNAYTDKGAVLDNFLYGGAKAVVVKMLTVRLVGLGVCIALFIIGLFCIFIDKSLSAYGMSSKTLKYIGMFTIAVSVWSAMEGMVLQFFFKTTELIHLLNYTALSMMPIPIALIGLNLLKNRKFLYRCSQAVYVASAVSAVTMSLLNALGIKGYHYTFNLSLAIYVCALVVLVASAVEFIRTSNNSKAFILGLSVIGVTALLDVWNYKMGNMYDSSFFSRIGICSCVISCACIGFSATLRMVKMGANAEVIQRIANEDALTGLYNRNCAEHDNKEYAAMLEHGELVGVVQFDVNGLKYINDNYGHEEGDNLIKNASGCILSAFGEQFKCYRVGGDEFTAVITGTNLRQKFDACYDVFLECVREINQDIPKHLKVAVAAGYAEGTKCKFSEIKNKADELMYIKKQEMKNMTDEEVEKTKKMIRYALDNDGVMPYYQPILNNETKKCGKVEALIRMRGIDGRLYAPNSFLDIARRYGLYGELSMEMIRKVFAAFDDRPETVSVNVAMRDIESEQMRNFIYDMLDKKHNGRIIIELLETEEFSDVEALISFVDNIRKRNALVAIDDFGSGYSTFKLLSMVKPDIIKIDGDIVKNIDKDELMDKILDTIVKLSKTLESEVVAEFVENQDIQRIMVDKEIQYTQGYFYSQPLPFSDLVDFLAESGEE